MTNENSSTPEPPTTDDFRAFLSALKPDRLGIVRFDAKSYSSWLGTRTEGATNTRRVAQSIPGLVAAETDWTFVRTVSRGKASWRAVRRADTPPPSPHEDPATLVRDYLEVAVAALGVTGPVDIDRLGKEVSRRHHVSEEQVFDAVLALTERGLITISDEDGSVHLATAATASEPAPAATTAGGSS